MIHFHLLPVKKVQQETDDCVSITFAVPEELYDTFQFIQGQSLTLRKYFNGEEVRRSYSICSSPYDNELKIAVKKTEGGIFSTYANEQLKADDILEVMPPVGTFYTELHPDNKKHYVAFAAGSGITPVLSIIKTTLIAEPYSTFTLIYGNRTKNNIIFKEAFEALKDKYMARLQIIYLLSREATDIPLNSGRIDTAKCGLLFEKMIDIHKVDDYFLCGPEQMIFTVKDFLLQNGVNEEHIHFELFTIPGINKSTVDTPPSTATEDSPKAQVSVKLDGITYDFQLAYNDQTILDAALNAGADAPYACKGGVCTTCKAKLLEGQVEMDAHWGLEQDEIDDGYILTCQSHPITEKVVVDYDV